MGNLLPLLDCYQTTNCVESNDIKCLHMKQICEIEHKKKIEKNKQTNECRVGVHENSFVIVPTNSGFKKIIR
jgi:hypothetical protein